MRWWIAVALLTLAPTFPASAHVPSNNVELTIAQAKALMLANPAAAARLARDGAVKARTIPDPNLRRRALTTSLWLEAEALGRSGDPIRAAIPLAEARVLAGALLGELELQGEILLTSGSIHGARGEVATALTDYLKAHRLFKQSKDQRKQAVSLVCLAMLYDDAQDYPTALRYLGEALDAYPTDPGLTLSIWNSRGIALREQGRYADAATSFRQAIAAARRVGSVTAQAQFLRNLARNELKAKQMRQADAAIAAAAALKGTTQDDSRQLDAVAAQAALQHGRLHDAQQFVDRAFRDIDLATTDLLMRDSHATAIAVYRALGRSDDALAHADALKRLDDKATRLATETSTALMAARFDSANQEAKIAQLRDAERLRQAREALQRARTERLFWLGGSGAAAAIILLLLVGLVTLRRSRDQVRAVNDDLAVTNDALGKALAAKTEFLATTSHEIRTPLNGILGMTQVMLADTGLSAPTRERLGVVQGAGLTMRALVDDILDVAKMETGHLTLERAPFDVASTLRDAARLWAEQARAKGLRFVVDVERCPPLVDGDAARVRQIAFNLLSNAVKFTDNGSITLTAEAADDGIRIAVADTGIGIAADKHEAVFESFRQADASTTREFGGTGLGLAIVRRLARAMGGDVALASTPGIGTIFTATLPLPAVASAAVACASASGDTLLVLERNPITRAMLRALLQPHIAAVAFAGTIAEALACVEAGTVTHVLIDEATARAAGDGLRFMKEIKALAGSAPVMLLRSPASEAERVAVFATGVDRLIVKPVTGASLVAALFGRSEDADHATVLVSRAA
ncbi:ATP-binding protein [Sphingomonas bacterium]|uniref:ATP-binding protein n=1 Tax=Sphingomonas bacterium TaxID=1895847 RepID=UPI001576225A|nr:ATP-binding protein [Sphingomonas bacterium]